MNLELSPEVLQLLFSETLYVFPETPTVSSSPLATEKTMATPTPASTLDVVPASASTLATPVIPKVSIPSVTSKTPEAIETVYTPLGKNSNGLLFVQHAQVNSTPGQRDLLKNIIVNGIKYNHEECGYLKTETPIVLSALEKLPVRIVVCFGIATDGFTPELKKEYYQIQRYNNITLLLADSLAAMEEKPALKAKLWNSLKELFGIR